MNNILFLGHGYVSQYFVNNIHLDNYNYTASINYNKHKYFSPPDNFNAIDFSKIDIKILDKFTNFVISIPPNYQEKTDIITQKFYNYFLHRNTAYKLIYLSATSVYGDHLGARIDENSALKAQSINGLARISVEKKYLDLTQNSFANIIILRLAGIYGPKRNNIAKISEKIITTHHFSKKITSRIHVADISNIIAKIITDKISKNEIFNLADNKPCPTMQVNDYICTKILKIPPLKIDYSKKNFRHNSFALDNKIVGNDKLLNKLQYQLLFSSYEEGLNNIYKQK